MSDISTSARIQIEVGLDGNRRVHSLFINGQDVGMQVGSVDFHAEGGEPAKVQVTFVNPHLTVEGFAEIVGVPVRDAEGTDRG